MKNILTHSIFVSVLMFSSAFTLAEEIKLTSKFETNIRQSANKVGLPAKDYLIATQRLEMLEDPNVEGKPDFRNLNTFAEYHEIINLINAEKEVPEELRFAMIKIMNTQKAKLASYLLIDVEKVPAVIEEYSSYREGAISKKTLSTDGNNLQRTNNTPTYVKYCTDRCNQVNSARYFQTVVWVHDRAQNDMSSAFGVTVNVTFKNRKTGRVFAKEQWRATQTHAYRIKELPCSSCANGDQ